MVFVGNFSLNISMLKERLNSFKYALAGLKELFATQPNAKFHLLATVVVSLAGWYFSISITEWCLLVLCIAFVIAAEAFNTSLEYLTNLVSPEFNPLAGKVKDLAAGAVLVSAIGAAVVGGLIFLPKLMGLF